MPKHMLFNTFVNDSGVEESAVKLAEARRIVGEETAFGAASA